MSKTTETGPDPRGFCPKVMESFFIGAEVVFGGHGDLHAVLEHLRAERFVLAVCAMKVCRYRSDHPKGLLAALERRVYSPICPHVNA